MEKKVFVSAAAAVVISLGSSLAPNPAYSDDIFDLMDPSWWFGDDDDDDYWRHYGSGAYPWGGPWSWGGWGYPGFYGPRLLPRAQVSQAQAPELPLPE